MEELKMEILEFEVVGKFLQEIKKKFGKEDKELKKVVELKKFEQRQRTMEEYI